MTLSARREATIRSRIPSEARIDRMFARGALTRSQAIDMAHAEHIAWAEAQQTRTTWNGTAPRRGHKAVVTFAECLTPEQAELAGIGIHAPRECRTPEQWMADINAAHDAVRFGLAEAAE